MRRRVASGILGGLFVLVGVVYAGNILNIWDIAINFDGWWTMFIILPCIYSIMADGFRFSNTLGLSVGVLLLLSAQDILPNHVGYKLIWPLIVVAIGVKIIFSRAFSGKDNDRGVFSHSTTMGNGRSSDHLAIFCGNAVNYDGLVFSGADCISIFGGVELNLRNAIIEQDCVINVVSIFGGTDVFLPPNVKAYVDSVPIFGGVSNKFPSNPATDAPKVKISAVSVFGGADIK